MDSPVKLIILVWRFQASITWPFPSLPTPPSLSASLYANNAAAGFRALSTLFPAPTSRLLIFSQFSWCCVFLPESLSLPPHPQISFSSVLPEYSGRMSTIALTSLLQVLMFLSLSSVVCKVEWCIRVGQWHRIKPVKIKIYVHLFLSNHSYFCFIMHIINKYKYIYEDLHKCYSVCVLICQRCISNAFWLMTALDCMFLQSRDCPFQCLIGDLKMVAELKSRSKPSSLIQKNVSSRGTVSQG